MIGLCRGVADIAMSSEAVVDDEELYISSRTFKWRMCEINSQSWSFKKIVPMLMHVFIPCLFTTDLCHYAMYFMQVLRTI